VFAPAASGQDWRRAALHAGPAGIHEQNRTTAAVRDSLDWAAQVVKHTAQWDPVCHGFEQMPPAFEQCQRPPAIVAME
jgi:hypothetical protein